MKVATHQGVNLKVPAWKRFSGPLKLLIKF